jgi:hypothetical protein
MGKTMLRNNSYDARIASLLKSVVQIETPQQGMSRIILRNRILGAQISGSPASIKYKVNTQIVQLANKKIFIFGRYYNI